MPSASNILLSLCSNIKPKNSVKFEIANSFLCNLLIIIKVLRYNSLGHSLFHTSLSYYISLTAFVVAENRVMRNIGQNIPCPEVFAFSYRVLTLCSQIYTIVNTSWKRVWGNVQPDMAPFIWEPSWLSRWSHWCDGIFVLLLKIWLFPWATVKYITKLMRMWWSLQVTLYSFFISHSPASINLRKKQKVKDPWVLKQNWWGGGGAYTLTKRTILYMS